MLWNMKEIIMYVFVVIFILIFVFIFILFTLTLILQFLLISAYLCIYIAYKFQIKIFAVEKNMPLIRNFGQVCI